MKNFVYQKRKQYGRPFPPLALVPVCSQTFYRLAEGIYTDQKCSLKISYLFVQQGNYIIYLQDMLPGLP